MVWNPQFALLLLVLIASPAVYAQRTDFNSDPDVRRTSVVESSAPAHLLNLGEGLAVIGAAMEMAHHRPPREDCSHFVHQIYDRAGFPYSYENSVTLYEGTGDFQQVTHPQPGDLIVWRGHMGIVVNPVQHSFFSSLRTGFGVEKYDSRYWRRRGRPRFYRYVKSATTPITLASAKRPADTSPGNTNAEESELHGTPEVAGDVPTEAMPASDSPPESTLPMVVLAERASPEALRQALEEKFSDMNMHSGNTDLLNSTKPVVIVDSFQVKKVHVKHDQGWAEVQMNEPSSLSGGQANLQRRSEKQRWPLYRNGEKWQLEVPSNAIYLPKDTAVRLLAHQLAAMTGQRTRANHGTQQEAQLARLLDRLLGE